MGKIMDFLAKSGNMQKRGEGLEAGLSSEMQDELLEEFFSDDSETKYKIGDRVQKATYDYGDVHEIGRPGVVIGAMLDNNMEIYMVKFEGDAEEEICMTLAYKLKLVK